MSVSVAAGTFTLGDVSAGVNVTAVSKPENGAARPSFHRSRRARTRPSLRRKHDCRARNDGGIPRIPIATAKADAHECLMRKTGVADSEFGIGGSGAPGFARVHAAIVASVPTCSDTAIAAKLEPVWMLLMNGTAERSICGTAAMSCSAEYMEIEDAVPSAQASID